MDTKPGILRTTLIGAVMYLIPIVLVVAILGKAMQFTQPLAPPLQRVIDAAHLGGILTPQIVGVLALLLVCFAAGLFSSTALAKRMEAFLDTRLGNIPGYILYKSVGESLAGIEPTSARPLVMVSMEDAWQIAVAVDKLEDGMLAVYIPGVPDARSGSLFFVSPDRVRPLSISRKSAMLTLRHMGLGSRELVNALPPDPSDQVTQR